MFELTKRHLRLYEVIHQRGLSRGCPDLSPDERKMLSPEEWKGFMQGISQMEW